MPKRKALGKGLSALIPDADEFDDGNEQFFQCPVEVIEPNPYQPRQTFSPHELEEMVDSVREKGIITPLLVTKTEAGYQLIAGERRWRAAQKAGLRRVPVVVREVSPSESLELALIENIHRKDLNPIEEAVAYAKLLEETRITQDALAKRLGKDRSSITNFLRLLKLPVQIQQDVIDGRLTMGHARLLAGLKNSEDQWTLRNAIIKRGLSVRQSEALAKRGKDSTDTREKGSTKDPYLRSLEDNLKRSLGTKVEIKKRGRKGSLVVHFYSDDELDRLLELLG
jgi:ParB family transcriptional regulator, chromosome partitioning protein